MVDYKLAASFN